MKKNMAKNVRHIEYKTRKTLNKQRRTIVRTARDLRHLFLSLQIYV